MLQHAHFASLWKPLNIAILPKLDPIQPTDLTSFPPPSLVHSLGTSHHLDRFHLGKTLQLTGPEKEKLENDRKVLCKTGPWRVSAVLSLPPKIDCVKPFRHIRLI